MLDISEAQKIVLENVPPGKPEQVTLSQALDHRLAEEVVADRDIPPFNRSAMDGYALRAESTDSAPVVLDVAGESRAGIVPTFTISRGQAAHIMTGSIVPKGADSVQVVEKTERLDGGSKVKILEPVKPWANISPQGNEVKRNAVVLETNRYIGAAEMAALATFGYQKVKVWKKPSVAVIATGDELVEVHQTPDVGQIRNSNAYALLAQLWYLGAKTTYLGIARDDKNDLREKITEGLKSEVLILTGGVSMGKYDLVEELFAELNVKIYFDAVSIKPGKPAVFGSKESTLVFGLPGNPVSSYVTFEYFVRPAILKLMGAKARGLMNIRAELKNAIRQKPGRTALLPAWTDYAHDKWVVEVLPFKGSADIVAFSRANSMCLFPKHLDAYETGDMVDVLLLDDFFKR